MRRIDALDLINHGASLDWLHQHPDADWDEMSYCFWIKVGSKLDTWLRIQNL